MSEQMFNMRFSIGNTLDIKVQVKKILGKNNDEIAEKKMGDMNSIMLMLPTFDQ